MKKYKILILGAGPAGLTFATRLLEKGEKDFVVLEKESTAGGLCRTEEIDGAPLDIGGGHILDVKRKNVTEYLFKYLPKSEWNIFARDSRIRFKGQMVGHPFESNIWQMTLDDQVDFLESIAEAGCVKKEPMPEKFVDWIEWKLGRKVSQEYMLPYNRKMFGNDLNQLGTYWLEKLPNVSFRDTLRSCLDHKAYGKEPGHAQFYYPKKHGYGEVWARMSRTLEGKLFYRKNVQFVDVENNIVQCDDGSVWGGNSL